MRTIKLQGDMHPMAVDSLLEGMPQDSGVDLQIPLRLKTRYYGGTAAAMQAISTWRAASNGNLKLWTDSDDVDYLRNLIQEEDHVLWGIILARRTTNTAGQDLTNSVVELAYNRLRKMDSLEPGHARRGQSMFAVAADHTPYDSPLVLYPSRSGTRPKTSAEMTKMLGRLFELWTPTSASGKPPADEVLELLGHSIHELFDNTHVWAKEDAYGRPIHPSGRLLRVERFSMDVRHQKMDGRADPISTFVAKLSSQVNQVRLFEVSIIDTGPGLAARRLWQLGKLVARDPAEEYRAVRDCLSKHFTSHRSPARGRGLHNAFRALSALASLILVRTGHLSVYRDFTSHPYTSDDGPIEDGADPGEPFMLDFVSGSKEMQARPHVQGTNITMLIPMEYHD